MVVSVSGEEMERCAGTDDRQIQIRLSRKKEPVLEEGRREEVRIVRLRDRDLRAFHG